ncbi:MAG: hypothetical protein V5B33_10155 [Candidatus Accumulibacter sp. UW20]
MSKQQPVQHTQQAVACGRLGQAGDETDFARQPDIARQRVSADGNDWRADELRIVAYQPERFVSPSLTSSWHIPVFSRAARA